MNISVWQYKASAVRHGYRGCLAGGRTRTPTFRFTRPALCQIELRQLIRYSFLLAAQAEFLPLEPITLGSGIPWEQVPATSGRTLSRWSFVTWPICYAGSAKEASAGPKPSVEDL